MKGLLVDDDELYARTLQRSLARKGIETEIALDAASALARAREYLPDFALVDLKLGSDSGLTLIEPLRALRADMQILLVTGYASVATAVESVKRGAFDFCEKPFSDNALVDRVERALALSEERLAQLILQRALQARLDELTERERDVLRLVAEGRPNKLIADELGISVRTVEVHRARVFEKMDVKSAVELSRALQQVPS